MKTTSHNFGLAIQDQISIKHKLENIEGLPTLELDFLSTDGQDGSTIEPAERPNLHQKQQIAKHALEKKYKVGEIIISASYGLFVMKIGPNLFYIGATETVVCSTSAVGKCSIYYMATCSVLSNYSTG